MFTFLPEQASSVAPEIDRIHDIITYLSVFFTVAICGAMVYFAVRYRERPGSPHPTPRIEGSHLLEMVWTVVPTIVCIFVGYYGVIYYRDVRNVPDNALTINVRAQKWKWDFEYDNGKATSGEFFVPVNQPIKLVMRSRDVIHSFFMPEMRLKADVIPDRYTYISFTPVKTGTFQVFCAEYCGDWHSGMLAKVHVLASEEYSRWLNDDSEVKIKQMMKPADRGRLQYDQKGCKACHSLNGLPGVGPTWLKIWDRDEELSDGSHIKLDENEIHTCVTSPNTHIPKGFLANVMPSFAGQLADSDIDDIIAFMKTLDGTNPEALNAPTPAPAVPKVSDADLAKMTPEQRGKYWYESGLCHTCHTIDGSKLIGPTFKGVYGRQEKMTTGETITVDDAYLKESIMQPMAKVVDTYPPAMPQGLATDAQADDIIAFLKTVK